MQLSFCFIKQWFCFRLESSVLAGKQASTSFKLKIVFFHTPYIPYSIYPIACLYPLLDVVYTFALFPYPIYPISHISHWMFISLRDAPTAMLNGCTVFNALCVSWLWRSLLMEKKLSKEEAIILLINLRVKMLTW